MPQKPGSGPAPHSAALGRPQGGNTSGSHPLACSARGRKLEQLPAATGWSHSLCLGAHGQASPLCWALGPNLHTAHTIPCLPPLPFLQPCPPAHGHPGNAAALTEQAPRAFAPHSTRTGQSMMPGTVGRALRHWHGDYGTKGSLGGTTHGTRDWSAVFKASAQPAARSLWPPFCRWGGG